MRGHRRLDLRHVANARVRFKPHETVYARGDRCAAVMYIQAGRVKLTVTSQRGREAVVAVLHAGAFFGEGPLAGQQRRRSTAETMTAATIAIVKTAEMRRRLHDEVSCGDDSPVPPGRLFITAQTYRAAPGSMRTMRFVHLFLVGYFVVILGIGLGLWQAGVFNRASPIWFGIGALLAIGVGIMLAVASGKPTATEAAAP